ncbi:hypothetical protein ACQ895_01535 [Vibrio parahaemolyticus]|uniref:hypothetical protein n=1 Tax=Vibrio parahaemolyticus TaxID=670 RepID=UPI00387B1CE1
MKKLLLIILIPFFANANTDIPTGDGAVLSLRYSETTKDNDTQPILGASLATLGGKGNFGFALSVDFQHFDVNGEMTNAGREKKEYTFNNVMVGATYGVTNEFYVIPKIGFTYSEYENHFADKSCIGNIICKDVMNSERQDEYKPSYGVDFMFLHNSIAYGLGINDYDYFGNRETRMNLNIGYKF